VSAKRESANVKPASRKRGRSSSPEAHWEDGWFFQEKQGVCGGFTNENGGLNNKKGGLTNEDGG
jgi:hypothetical protein